MKKTLWAVAFILLLNIPVLADDNDSRVTVYGSATIEVTPDEMFWSLKITNKGPEIEKIAKQHSKIVSTVISFLDESDVPEDSTQTSMMGFGENWEHANGRREQKGYFASSHVSFKLTDFSKYQHLWIELSKIKNLSIRNIGYDYSKRIQAQDKARINALLAAQKKARSMAKTLDVDLGDPLIIEDIQIPGEILRSNMAMAGDAGSRFLSPAANSFALGKIEIKSKVKVVYLIN